MVTPTSASNETVLELRFRPNALVLDHRGAWAENLSAHMSLPEWQIVENRLDIYSTDKTHHLFVGFRNAGMAYANTPSTTFFAEKAQRFLRRLFSLEDFGDPLHIERLGVRHKLAIPTQTSFIDLVEHFASEYVQLSASLKDAFGGATLIDIGAPLNYKDGLGFFNTSAGPMQEAQFKDFFRKKEGLPATGLYIDVDYWVKPEETLSSSDVISKVHQFTTAAQQRATTIRQLALAEPSGKAS